MQNKFTNKKCINLITIWIKNQFTNLYQHGNLNCKDFIIKRDKAWTNFLIKREC